MALNQNLIVSYRNGVYVFGTRELHDNKGATVPDVHPTYVDAVMQHAANTLTLEQIGTALSNGYITQAEYDATIALMPATETPAPETSSVG